MDQEKQLPAPTPGVITFMKDGQTPSTTLFLQAVRNLCGGWYFELRGDDAYENIVRFDVDPAPTKQEIINEFASLTVKFNNTKYQRDRALEYPSAGDLADAIFWEKRGDLTKINAYMSACDAVKAKYPKPGI